MKVLVFGGTGQVARALRGLSGPSVEMTFLDRARADFNDLGSLGEWVRTCDTDVIVNAAAYTAVDAAEADEATAQHINADAPGAIARAAAERGLPMLHISSDYVFDGGGAEPFQLDATPRPLSAYGRTKLDGEEQVRSAECAHVILRTSWIFSATGHNFLKTMLSLGAARETIDVVADQVGGPTPAGAVAEGLVVIARAMTDGQAGGTYHLSGAPDTSWANFARAIFAEADLSCRVRDIATADYPTPAPRPRNSRLDCTTLTADFGIQRPDWRTALAPMIKDLTS